MESSFPHAVILSTPGMGHSIPIIELAKTLVANHKFHVTIINVQSPLTPSSSQHRRLLSPVKHVDTIDLSLPHISHLIRPDSAVVTQLSVTMREICAPLRSTLATLRDPPSVFIADFFGFESLQVAHELNIPKHIYFPTSAWFLALTTYVSVLDKVVDGEFLDPIGLPGCKTLQPGDIVDPMVDRSDQQYDEYVRISSGVLKADGILLNTWEELEGRTLEALREKDAYKGLPRLYPIGPLIRSVISDGSASDVLKWLDQHPKRSVIFLSFGSHGTLSGEQMVELAWGLERSGTRFVWVVRPPTESGGMLLELERSRWWSEFLPDGFLERTEKVGMVVGMWGEQRAILEHVSIGGFVSHCGWNSTLESFMCGVPMIGWPLYAEQKMNAAMLNDELRVAVRVEENDKGLVVRDKIEVMLRNLINNDLAIRERVRQVQLSGLDAIREGGSSHDSLARFVKTLGFSK